MLQPQNSATPHLGIKRLTYISGGDRIIDDVSLTIPTAAKVALVGLNGAGKSTLIRLLVGELALAYGSIYLAGHTPQALALKAQLGYQASAMMALSELGVREYLQLSCLLKGRSREQSKELILSVSEQWALQPLLDRPMQQLSQGNMQKVAIAQAFIGSPDFIFLDEPSHSLDPLEQLRFIDNLKSLTDFKICLFSSHHINEAVSAADRVVLLHHGRVVASLDLKAHNEHWIVSNLEPQQLQSLSDKASIEHSYARNKRLYKISVARPEDFASLLAKAVAKDKSVIDLGRAGAALLPLFSLLANEGL